MPVCEVIEDTHGRTSSMFTGDDVDSSGNPVESTIVVEGVDIGTTNTSFGQITIDAYTYSAKIFLISRQLLQDTVFDLESYLTRIIGVRNARGYTKHHTIGTGTAQPDGIAVTGTDASPTHLALQILDSSTAKVFTVGDLLALQDKIDDAYKASPNCRWMFRSDVRTALRQLVVANDTTNNSMDLRGLWEPSMQQGDPELLLGYPYQINQYLPEWNMYLHLMVINLWHYSVTSLKVTLIRLVRGLSIQRLEERYAEFLSCRVPSLLSYGCY